jgi:hypothetical protein
VDRRRFLGHVVLGSTVASLVHHPLAARTVGGLRVKFVGMMGYVSRSDQSLLIALPGEPRMGQSSHVPFLMARTGSAVARALGLTAMPGVEAGAFDMELTDAPSEAFVFRCLDGADLEVASQTRTRKVDNRATQLAHMQAVAPGKRLRRNLRRWAQATVSLEGGILENSAAHPDAGKVWSFGDYKQHLTDATLYSNAYATVRLSAGSRVSTFAADSTEPADLWVVSSAGPRTDAPNPKRLAHGHLLFEYFADAEPVTPTCEEAEGRITLATELPCASTTASSRGHAAGMAPPFTDLCPGGLWCCE